MTGNTPPGVKLISSALFTSVGALASASPRRRMNHNFHSSPNDNAHRFLNVLLYGSYIRPHRHLHPPKAESFLVLEGAADMLLFDDHGEVTARFRVGSESPEGRLWGVDLPAGVWHTAVSRSPKCVCFEVKTGPWDPASDKEFALWAPAENDPAAAAYCQALLERE